MTKRSTILIVLMLLAGCGSDVTPVLTCEKSRGITPVCNMQNPEDLARIGNTSYLVVSQFGAMDGSKSGNLALFNTLNNTFEIVFPKSNTAQAEAGWGEQSCPGAPDEDFSPHGIDLDVVSGRQRLLVVNHGGRESVEFFEVLGEQSPSLIWRGCVLAQKDQFYNDVVNLSNGGFLATHMMPRSAQFSSNLKGLLGFDTGFVVEWTPKKGFKKVAGTDSPFPNGIEISEDEKTVFLNVYMAGEVRKISRPDGELLGLAEVSGPDNVTWSDDGHLLVASHVDGISELLACNAITEGSCGFGFEIVSIDPLTMKRETVFSNRGAPMGGVTVALVIDARMYLGTFAGDRLAYIERKP